MNNGFGSFRFTPASNDDYAILLHYIRGAGEVSVSVRVTRKERGLNCVALVKTLNEESESFDQYDNDAAIERYSLETVQAFREAYGFTGAFDWADHHGRVFHVNEAGEKVYSNQVRAA